MTLKSYQQFATFTDMLQGEDTAPNTRYKDFITNAESLSVALKRYYQFPFFKQNDTNGKGAWRINLYRKYTGPTAPHPFGMYPNYQRHSTNK